MKCFLFFFLMVLARNVYAFDEEHLQNLHEQIKSGQRVYAVGFNLQNADLTGLHLKEADFSKANLKGANLSQVIASKASFKDANLKGVNLSGAVVNGAKFKGARLLNAKYKDIRSAKGTLFENKEVLLEKIAKEERKHVIKQAYRTGLTLTLTLDERVSLKDIHHYLYQELKNKSRDNKEYLVLRFEPRINGEHMRISRECSEFLRKPLFSLYVKSVNPICQHQALIVFLECQQDVELAKKNHPRTLLDLHGKIPLEVKYKLIDHFIQKAFHKHIYTVEIITGRGIHNPQGKRGVLWKICHQYLMHEKFKPYIQKITSISKEGGWKVVLKKKGKNKNLLHKKADNTTFYGSHLPFKFTKLILEK